MEQQPAATVLPSGVQQLSRAQQMTANLSLQSSKPNTSVNFQPSNAVISGKFAKLYIILFC